MKKTIVVGGFSKEQREKDLEKIKTKYEKKGYKFLEFIENGALKSVAVFEVEKAIVRKEQSKNLILLGVLFLGFAAILYIKATLAQ
ncbi:hypothetical protein [Halarcobacter sp.]|uniref:hypothetical protein n=1 Tax=Halarcobacter sp. TaxID=2321133 RepID=UPI002AAAD3ED|nr:hypothetical protein [Halarcobacter sp.]